MPTGKSIQTDLKLGRTEWSKVACRHWVNKKKVPVFALWWDEYTWLVQYLVSWGYFWPCTFFCSAYGSYTWSAFQPLKILSTKKRDSLSKADSATLIQGQLLHLPSSECTVPLSARHLSRTKSHHTCSAFSALTPTSYTHCSLDLLLLSQCKRHHDLTASCLSVLY